ncbi:MAG TPA: FkbM family methyltransferase [Chthoniobacterales bacterium]|nr:FkbM family methyltransferase [Chthoniobacterales bacterium]
MEEYYAAEKKVFSALRDAGFKPRVIYDVGASHTPWSQFVFPVFPEAEYYLFEPLVDFKPYYRQQCQIAVKHFPSFRLFKIGLGEVSGPVEIFSDAKGFSASILSGNTIPALDERFTVQLVRMDELIEKKRLPVPDLLKMDVQGAELEVLRGAGKFLERVQVIEAETWLVRGYGPRTPLFHEVAQFLTTKGFAILEIGDRFYSDSHEFYALDVFFVRRDLLGDLSKGLPAGPLT